MNKLSLDKFVELVERSKLIEHDRFVQAVGEWKSRASIAELDNAQFCADHLVETGLLTLWQCKKLLEGRYRGFFLGKYRLLDHLGSGGMSSVYLAEHVLMQRRVALKVLPHNRVADASYLARFHLEAQAAAALDHRNIVRAFDLDNEGKTHYLVMEYIEGRDLHAMVCQDGPLDFHQAAHYIAQAATGLEHAHHCELIHRDIKPANLLVDLKGTVKILDMGLAKFTTANRPTPGFAQDEHVLGTADYLAPEQAINSQTVDSRADIYALGCTLYFLLTGHPPFAEGTPLERMTAHQQQLAPSVLLDRPDTPPALLAICRKMMEKSAENRYQTATEVSQALHDWLASEAAIGKIVPSAAAGAVHATAGPGKYRELPKSRANLVSGSAIDLHSASGELPRLSSPLGDTDPNLHRATVKIPSHVLESKTDLLRPLPRDRDSSQESPMPKPGTNDDSSSGSFRAMVPPPFVGPPPSPPVTTWDSPERISSVTDEQLIEPFELVPEVDRERAFMWSGRRKRAASGANWFWVFVLSVLVLVALFLTISSLPD